MNRAVFFDRDGVINVPIFKDGRSFAPRTLADFKIYENAKEALELVKRHNLLVVVITNQPDINAHYISDQTITAMHKKLIDTLPIDTIKVCPHKQDEGCLCRKPNMGLIIEACQELNIDSSKSFLVGDRKSDIEAGIAAKCTCVFIDHNYHAEEKTDCANYICKDILGAVHWIIKQL